MQYNIDWDATSSNYALRYDIHGMLQKAYEARGLTYGGRTLFTDYNPNNVFIDKNGDKRVKGLSHTFINNKPVKIGYIGIYTKMVPEIHREVLHKVFDSIYQQTNKHLLDKFNSYHFTYNPDGIRKIKTVTLELISDLKKAKAWEKEIKDIIDKAEKEQLRLLKSGRTLKQNEHLISIEELERLGTAILGRAVELCPIETGFLRRSGKLYVYNDYIRIIFECPYSLYVHENMNTTHAFGQAKFLETAAQEMLRNTSVWVESTDNLVLGDYMKQVWDKANDGRATGMPDWVEQHAYQAVYIDINRDLKVTYAH